MRIRHLLTTILTLIAFATAQAQPSSWDWAYGSPNGTNEYVRDIATDTINGGVYSVGGYDHVSSLTPITVLGQRDGFVTKTDANGNVIWTKQIGGLGDDGCQGVAVGSNGNIYVTGYFSGNLPTFGLLTPLIFNNGQQDLFIVCYDANGALQWVQTGGGNSNDIGFSVAVNASGVFVHGVFKNSSAFSGSNTNAGANNGRQHVTLLKYSLAGALQWQIVGYNNGTGDDNAERLACDANGVYATGSFGSTQMNWFNVTLNATQPATTTTTTGNQNIYVCSISNTGAQNWGKSVGNPTNYTPSANAITVGCGAVYIAGNTVNGSVFPANGAVSIASTPGDYLYLAALDKTTGGTKWVRTAYGVDPVMAIAYDLTVNRYGNVLMCGQFQRDTQFSDGTTIGVGLGGGYKADVFVARYTSYGQMDWVLTATGADDDIPMAVAADNNGSIFTGGLYKSDLSFPGLAAINANNASYFAAKLTDTAPSYWSNNPTAWYPTTPMCASSAPVDLTSTLPAFSREYVDVVVSSTGVTNPNNIIGAPNGTVTSFSANGNTITTDLTVTISTGNTFAIIWGKTAAVGGTASFQLETSSDNVSWTSVTAPSITATSSALRTSIVQAVADTRYVRITMNTAISAINFKVDALRFFHGSLQGGTWFGTGVTPAGIFNAAGLSGPVVITYTVGSSPCATSTSKTITVQSVATPGTMTVAPVAMQCPGNNSGTVTLSGFTGTINNWESSTDNFSSFTAIVNTTATQAFSNLPITTSFRTRLNGGACGDIYSAIGTVTVGDLTPPTISCPGNMSLNATAGVCGVVVNYVAPIGTDNCAGATTVRTSGLASGAIFPVGATTITHTVTDAAGLTATCSFNVTVVDNIAPLITCPANISVNVAAGTCGAVVNYVTPIGTDNCTGATTVRTSGLASGAIFPVGVTTITHTVTDAAGLTATCSFNVTVVDNIAPQITCPGNVSVNAEPGTCGATVSYVTPIGTDNCTGATTALTSGLASGATFPVGVTTVTHVVTDAAGLTATCSFTVTVIDNQPPVASCPPNETLYTPASGCLADYNVPLIAITDNCLGVSPSGNIVLTPWNGVTVSVGNVPMFDDAIDILSGTTVQLPPGIHTFSDTLRDGSGNSTVCSWTVTVIDDQAPVLTCPANITLNAAAGACGATALFAASAIDNCSASPTIIYSQNPGTSFPVGTTIVTVTASDGTNTSVPCSFTVTVVDNIAPQIACPANLSVNTAVGTCGAVVNYVAPVGTDNCAGAITTLTAGLASGSTFPVGVSTVIYTVADVAGLTASCSFTVTVIDNIAPQISCPSNISVNVTPGTCGAAVNYVAPVGTDNCPGAVTTRTAGLASGSNFPVGVSTVTYTVTDAAGLTASCSFTVTVVDNIAPQITCPANINVNTAAGTCGAVVNYVVPVGIDNCAGTTTIRTSGLASGSTFPVGISTVTYTVTDAAGLTANCSFTVTVVDNIAPQIPCPANLSVNTTAGMCGAVVNYTAPIGTDNCAGATTIRTAGPAPGSIFSVGVTTVTHTVTDATGLTASCSFTVTVVDNIAPQITCPANINVNTAAGTCGAVVNYVAPVGTDNCAGAVTTRTAGLASGSTFPVGVSTVTYTVTDATGLTASCSFTVTVVDNIAPQITCPANINVNTAAGTCGAVVNYVAPIGTDNCAGAVTTRTAGLASGSTFPVGVSTVTYTVTDAAGLTASCSFTVTVVDNIAPQITCPANINVNTAAGTCGAVVNYVAPVGTDNCAGATTIRTMGLASGSTFPMGVSTTTYIVTDAAGLTANCSFTVAVVDNIAPTINCPTDVLVTAASGACGATASFSATATDNCQANPSITYSQNPGTIFPIGITNVTVTASDGTNTSAPCSFTVTVNAAPQPALSYGFTELCGGIGFISPTLNTPAGGTFGCTTLGSALNTSNGSIDLSLLTSSAVHTVQYTVGSACPQTVSANLTLSLPPSAGVDASTSICSADPITDLFPLLGPDAESGGSWIAPGGIPFNGNYDPVAHGSGTYSYTVPGTAPCLNETATITVVEMPPVSAGIDNQTAACSGSSVDLDLLLSGNTTTGTWSSGTNNVSPTETTTYTYTVDGGGVCPNDMAVFIVNIVNVDDNDPCTIDTCVNGLAVHTPVNVDDGDACTIDTCVNGLAVHTPVEVDDNDPCTIDTCVNGLAVHTPVNVDDGDACTIDSCVNGLAVHTPVNVDDGDACTIDTCVNGLAVHTPVDVDDNDPCTIDTCVNGLAVHTPVNVDDGDACTIDTCVNGLAVHTPVNVDDGDACTIDSCVNGLAVHTPVNVDDGDACTIDSCVNGLAVHTPVNVDDGDACTIDTCVNGLAVHTPVDVDDNDPCTIDTCVNGLAVHTPVNVDDGDACTIDTCVNGLAVHTPVNVDDGDACTIDTCVNGLAVHTPVNVDDGDACTIDSCVNGLAVHTPVNVDDGDACTIDSCVNGLAVHTPVNVDDGDACTIDTCVNGLAVHTPVDVDDNDPCTIDTCVNGLAVHTPVNVDDGDACTIDTCVNGLAVHTPVNVDDGDACTIDTCVNGLAVHTPVDVDDNDPCTIDTCVNGLAVHTPVNVDDGDACTIDTCVNGLAVHTPVDVDDNDACTIDTCVNGLAVHTPVDVDDNDACTIDTCVNGLAVHTPVDVDDNDPCTIDTCVNGLAVHTPVNVDDGDACTIDTCVNGLAVHTPVNVDDGDACTIDTCVNGLAVHTPVNVDDGDACTIDTCVNGLAVHTPVNVDDGDACTIDTCVNGLAVHTPVDVDDNDPCTIDTCVNGLAVHTPVNVDDGDACTIDTCVNGLAVHTPVDVDDNDACTIDTCVNGLAVHTPVDVDDNDPCTIDTCVNGLAVHTPVNVDDGDACTIDTCVNGLAVHTPVDVDDNDPCTIDTCVNGLAVHTPVNVDDGDACTIDTCVNGLAVHTPVDVDDNDPCTIDTCVNGLAVHTPVNVDDGDACTIDTCVNGLAVHTPVNVDDGDACTIDTCVNGLAVHTPVNVDDGDACTIDTCVNGLAVHTPVNVDDGDACTIDSCVNGLAVHTPVDVDDNDACTIDTCVNGLAVHTPVNVDDGDACTIDSCVNGLAVHTPVDVDDNDPCTIDTCVNGLAVHTPVNVDDGDACTIDTCVNGLAVHTPVNVDDGDACTIDTCVNGLAVHTPVNVDDGDACTIDSCVNGLAVHTPVDVDDNDACTIDTCVNGLAVHTPVNVDDGDACTIDSCVNGLAVHTPVDVDDNDPCTIDTCVNGLAVHTPVNVDDGDACTIDTCVNGLAVHTPVNVDDGDACTIDTCVNGLAVHTPVNVDDGDACTIDTCVNGLAVHTPVNVDDGDACTIDTCVNGLAVHTPVNVDDGDACTIDTCVNGLAVHTPVNVDDGDACTIDSCVNGLAVHTPVNVDDGDACTIDTCVNGLAVHTPVDVDDNDPCTIDTCVNGLAVHTPVNVDDGDACTIDTCVNGLAVHTPVNVDDGDACTIDTCVNGLAVHTPVNVDDGDACTIDTCVNGIAVHTPISAPDASWNSPGTLCASVGPIGLNGYVTGDPNGTWSGNGMSGSVFNAQGTPGVYAITYTVGSGACQSQQTHVITIVAVPDAQAGEDAAVCGLSCEMQASSNSMITGTWTLTLGLAANSSNDPNATVTASAYGTYTLVWTVTNGVCSASDTVVVTFHDPGAGIMVDAGPDQFLDVITSTFLNGQASPGASLQWSLSTGSGSIINPNEPSTEITGLGIGDNVFVLSVNIGQCASTLDTVLVHVDDLFIPEGYSPNGDGVNDSWEITGMAAFPGSELRIFNRWGQEVYQMDSYANQWDGRANNGRPLPDDTYFYVLNLSGDRTYNGHVIIKR